MIRKLILKNIQSHEDTELNFDSGVNVIIGSSNNGKSAILRGLYWVRYNRPLGVDTLCSHWNLTDKGDIKNEMLVTVENDLGTVTRKRTKSENQYIVNGKVLNVVKSDVPEEVEYLLNLSDTNIQKQLDEPFLLSKTSGEVAKYFNQVVKLDVIDKVLTNAETSRRKVQSDIKSIQEQIKLYEDKLQNFDWLETVEVLLNRYKIINDKITKLNSEIGELEKSLSDFEMYSKQIVDMSPQKKLIEDIDSEGNKNQKLLNDVESLTCSISEVENQKIYSNFENQKKIIKEIESFDNSKLVDGIDELEKLIYDYNIQEMHVRNSKEDIECLKKQLPDICPLCGSVMKNGVCINA